MEWTWTWVRKVQDWTSDSLTQIAKNKKRCLLAQEALTPEQFLIGLGLNRKWTGMILSHSAGLSYD